MEVRQWMKETYTWEKLSKLMMDLGIDCKVVMKKMYMKYKLMQDLMGNGLPLLVNVAVRTKMLSFRSYFLNDQWPFMFIRPGIGQ